MHLLQEWEQSITDFDKVVRTSFIQVAKCLKEIEQHLRETAGSLKGTKQSLYSNSSQETSTSVYVQSSTCCPIDVNLESRAEDNCVEYYVAQNPCQYSVQSSPRLIPVREVPSKVYSSASGGSQESLTSETDSEFDGLSSQEQCQNIVIIQCHPVFPVILIKSILVIYHIHQHTQDILINICSSKCQLVVLDISPLFPTQGC